MFLLMAFPAFGEETAGTGSEPAPESKQNVLPTRKTPGHVPVRPAPFSEQVPENSLKPVAKSPGDTLRTLGIVTTMAGAAALGAGIMYHLTYNQQKDKQSSGKTPWTSERQDNLNANKTYAFIGYGLGVVGLGAGATLYYLGWKKDRASLASLMIAPLVTADVVVLNVGGRF